MKSKANKHPTQNLYIRISQKKKLTFGAQCGVVVGFALHKLFLQQFNYDRRKVLSNNLTPGDRVLLRISHPKESWITFGKRRSMLLKASRLRESLCTRLNKRMVGKPEGFTGTCQYPVHSKQPTYTEPIYTNKSE